MGHVGLTDEHLDMEENGSDKKLTMRTNEIAMFTKLHSGNKVW